MNPYLKRESRGEMVTLSAGCALAAALVFVELNQTGDGSDNVCL